ncbi:MAG: glutathione S-transferase family protein [Proteobacteria bacterium]|nr:glutathione S-transferase family protein [Pseudomonadota bacterium]
MQCQTHHGNLDELADRVTLLPASHALAHMTSSIKLYGPRSGSSLRTHWVAAEVGMAYDTVPVDFSKGEHKGEAFLAINPMGQVPALVDGDFKLAESMAIGSYLIEKAGSDLGGKTAQQRAQAWQWSLWAALNLYTHLATLASPAWTQHPLAPDVEAAAKAGAAKYLPVLDKHLGAQRYMAGDSFTVGDINVATVLAYGTFAKYDMSSYPHVTTWLAGVTDRPSYAKATNAANA